MAASVKTTCTGDARQVIGILAWARDAGLEMSTVTVGSCRVELHRRPSAEPSQRPTADDRSSIYGQFGGPALAHIVESEVPGEEMQPVIGRTQ